MTNPFEGATPVSTRGGSWKGENQDEIVEDAVDPEVPWVPEDLTKGTITNSMLASGIDAGKITKGTMEPERVAEP